MTTRTMLYLFKCNECGLESEHYVPSTLRAKHCNRCGERMKRVGLVSRGHRANRMMKAVKDIHTGEWMAI